MTLAWAQYVNEEKGGLNGHRVEIIVGDNGGDPARHRALVQEFVERRGVIAFLNNFESFGGEGSVEYLTSKRIPVIGSELGSNYFYDHPTYFPHASGGDLKWAALLSGLAQVLKAQNKSKLAILYCAEIATCKAGGDDSKREAEQLGLSVVYYGSTTLSQPDYSAECLSARNAGAEAFWLFLEGTGVRRLAISCARQNYRPAFSFGAQALPGDMLSEPTLQGMIVPSEVFSRVLDSTPASAEFQSVLRKYLPGKQPGGLTPFAWVGGKVLQRGAAKLSEPPTNESLLGGLWSIKNDDMGGLTQPLTYDSEHGATRVVCWFVDRIEDGKLKVVDGGARHCRQ